MLDYHIPRGHYKKTVKINENENETAVLDELISKEESNQII